MRSCGRLLPQELRRVLAFFGVDKSVKYFLKNSEKPVTDRLFLGLLFAAGTIAEKEVSFYVKNLASMVPLCASFLCVSAQAASGAAQNTPTARQGAK